MFSVLLVVAGSFMLLAGAFLALRGDSPKQPSPAPLPQVVGGLPLRSSTTGSVAVAEIARLHAKDFDLVSAAVGVYGSENEATLWVSGTRWKFQAGDILAAMHTKIGEGRSPFQPLETRSVENRRVYVLEGMGQMHFYFQSGKLVVWLAARPDLAEQALSQALAFYP